MLVGLSGYALHRANRRPRLSATGAQAPWTPAQGPSSLASPAPAAAGAATTAWDTVLPTARGTPQPTPSPGEADWVAAEQPAPVTLQALPPAHPGPAAPTPSAALATLDSTVPTAPLSPTPSPTETPVKTTPAPGESNDAAVLEQDGGAVTADNVPEGGGERLQGGPRAGRAQDNPSGAFTPTTLRARVRWRHVDRPRPPARPSFWQWLFGHKETTKAKPGKPRD